MELLCKKEKREVILQREKEKKRFDFTKREREKER
jgi:hypothetical protein